MNKLTLKIMSKFNPKSKYFSHTLHLHTNFVYEFSFLILKY